MSQKDYEIAEEAILLNTSITSISKTNISHRKRNEENENENSKYLNNILLAKYSDLDATNQLYRAKQKEIVDVKINLKYDFDKTIKEVDEIDADIRRLKQLSEELEVKRNEAIQVVSQQNLFLKCVEKQLDTKSLLFEQIIPCNIEKQTSAISTLSSDCDSIKKTLLEKFQNIQNIKELQIDLMTYNREYTTQLAVLDENDHNPQYQQILLVHQQKLKELLEQKESLKCANDAQMGILRELMNENVNLNEKMNEEINSCQDILNINNAQQERFILMNKTFMEKKANYLNIKHCLLPSVQTKKLDFDAILQNYIIEKDDLTKNLDHLNNDLNAQAINIEQLQAITNHLDFHYSKEKETLIGNTTKLDNSIRALNSKKEQLQERKEEAILILGKCREDFENLTNSLNKCCIETDVVNKKLIDLTENNNFLAESTIELQNSLTDLCDPECIDIEKPQNEINIIRSDIDNMKLEIVAKEKLFSYELKKAESIDLVTLDTKLKRLKKQKKHIIDTIEKKIEIRESIMGRVTNVEIDIQELLKSKSKMSDNFQCSKTKSQNAKADMGILKRLGEKSPAKRVHFDASLASMSSQHTEGSSQSKTRSLIENLFDPNKKSRNAAPDSPPTRLHTKKSKH